MVGICIVTLLLTCMKAEVYNTRVRRSIWISTPAGIQYQSHIIPSHSIHPRMFFPYQRDVTDEVDSAYSTPVAYRGGTKIEKPYYEEDEKKSRKKRRSMLGKIKSGFYDAVLGGGISRIFVYIFVAVLFAIIGYQIRKQEEYGSYVRLPAEDS